MNDSRLAALFAEFLDAVDEGRDISEELLARAGAERADLEAKIRLERELRALSRELDLDQKTPGTPQLLGRFQILGSLGQGGIGRVFLAFDPELGRRIALKVLDREVLLDKDQRAWILNEARSLARISHSNVVKVFEVGETATHAYVAMEHLSGPSLQEVIREWTHLREGSASETPPTGPARALAERLEPFSARIELLARLADALAHCHDHGILHRDIKPQNVLFDSDGAPKLIDFGLAHLEGADEDSRLGLTQTLVGTAAYIAPEQAASDQTGADPRSDQFSFATLAYECFALENPFLRQTRRATIDAIELADPPALAAKAPSVPPDLARVIRHAHEREPEVRYPGLAAFAADLRAILASRPISIEEPSLLHVARLWLRRHRRGVAVASAALSLGLLLLLLGWTAMNQRRHATLLAGLGRVEPAGFQRLEDFDRTFDPLLALKQGAKDFDSGWLRARLWGATVPEVDRTVHAWAAGIGASYARDEEQSRTLGRPVQWVMYRRLLAKEEALCEECTENKALRGRGRVRYPPEKLSGLERALDLLMAETAGATWYPRFVPTSLEDYPVPGTYRLQAWRAGADQLAFESVFLVEDGWPEALELELAARDPELWQEARPVEFGPQPLLGGGSQQIVPGFRILPRYVTVAEYRAFCRTSAQDRVEVSKTYAPDAPVQVDLFSAIAFARWAGARLPLLAEVQRAEAEGVLTPRDLRLGGEYLIDLSPAPGSHTFLRYYPSEADPTNPLGMVLYPRSAVATKGASSDQIAHVGFRIVFADDRPSTYRAVSREPLEESAREASTTSAPK